MRPRQIWVWASTYPMQGLNRSVSIFIPSSFKIPLIELVFFLAGHSPQMPTGAHSHIDDTTCPDVDGSRIKLATAILFRGNVRGAATKSSSHVSFFLPSHTETFAISEICNFESTMGGQ